MGIVEIDGTITNALIDTGASVNVTDLALLQRLMSCPTVRPTRGRIHHYGSTAPLPLQRVIKATIVTGTRRTKTKLCISHGSVGTLLGCCTSEILGLAGFTPKVYEPQRRTINDMVPATQQRKTKQLRQEWHRGITPGVTIGQNRDIRGQQRCQNNCTPINVTAGLKEDQWPNGSDLDKDCPLPESHPTSGSPVHHCWRCIATQREMGLDTEEAEKGTMREAYLGAISPQEIKAAMDADICLAQTGIALHTKRWTDFKDGAKVMSFRERAIMRHRWKVRRGLGIDTQDLVLRHQQDILSRQPWARAIDIAHSSHQGMDGTKRK